MLSVDTGIRGIIRREASTKHFAEQSAERRSKRTKTIGGTATPSMNNSKQTSGANSPRNGGLPAITEGQFPDDVSTYSPTRYLKESLRLHGKLMRSSMQGSRLGGNGDLYEEFV